MVKSCLLTTATASLLLIAPVLEQPSMVGTMTDELGSGLPNVQIIARSEDDGTVATAITDDNGQFVLRDMAAGGYTVTALKPGFVSATYGVAGRGHLPLVVVVDQPRVEVIALQLERASSLAGEVVSRLGVPIGRRIVELKALQPERLVRGIRREAGTLTDDFGRFGIDDIAPGTYVLAARPAGVAVRAIEERVDADRTALVTFDIPYFYPRSRDFGGAARLDIGPGQHFGGLQIVADAVPVYPIRGTVTDGGGHGIRNVRVAVVCCESGTQGQQVTGALSTDGGSFFIPYVPAGDIRLIVETLGDVPGLAGDLRLSVSGGIEGLSIVVNPQAALRGTINNCGGASGLAVVLEPVVFAENNWVRRATVGSDGRFAFGSVPPGDYWVKAELEAGLGREPIPLALHGAKGTPVLRSMVALASGRITEVMASLAEATGELHGTVFSELGSVVFDQLVGLWADHLPREPPWRPLQVIRPRSDGTYRFRHLVPGRYRVAILAGGVQVAAGSSVEPVESTATLVIVTTGSTKHDIVIPNERVIAPRHDTRLRASPRCCRGVSAGSPDS